MCVAKTQYSFSTDPTLRGAPLGHTAHVREVRLSAGAGFVVVVCGDMMTMPGLPKAPAAARIDLADDGTIVGLSSCRLSRPSRTFTFAPGTVPAMGEGSRSGRESWDGGQARPSGSGWPSSRPGLDRALAVVRGATR